VCCFVLRDPDVITRSATARQTVHLTLPPPYNPGKSREVCFACQQRAIGIIRDCVPCAAFDFNPLQLTRGSMVHVVMHPYQQILVHTLPSVQRFQNSRDCKNATSQRPCRVMSSSPGHFSNLWFRRCRSLTLQVSHGATTVTAPLFFCRTLSQGVSLSTGSSWPGWSKGYLSLNPKLHPNSFHFSPETRSKHKYVSQPMFKGTTVLLNQAKQKKEVDSRKG